MAHVVQCPREFFFTRTTTEEVCKAGGGHLSGVAFILLLSGWQIQQREKGISCPQFSGWSIFMGGNFDWWKILGRHLSSCGFVTSLFWKIKTWKSGRGWWRQSSFFQKLNTESFIRSIFYFDNFCYQRGKSRRMHEISGVWQIGERNIVDRLL